MIDHAVIISDFCAFELTSVTMFLALELGVALAILAQPSPGQSMVSSVYYQKISIEASSWRDIRAHTLKGLEHEITFLQAIFQKKKNILIADRQGFNVHTNVKPIRIVWHTITNHRNATRLMVLVWPEPYLTHLLLWQCSLIALWILVKYSTTEAN